MPPKATPYLVASLALLSATLTAPASQACTRALWNTASGQMLSARNLDFFGPVRPSLVVSPRGVARSGASGEDAAHTPHWKARYGSVMVYADDTFPMDGMNEKGLAGHTLFYTAGEEAIVPGQAEKPVLESRHWLTFLLDNHSTVSEAVEAIRGVRLVPRKLPIDYASDTKHIALEDSSGDSAIIEITQGQVHIFHGRQYTVMTNPPDYATMIQKMDETRQATPTTIPGGWDAVSRLTRANWLLKNLPQPDQAEEARGFLATVMNSVAMPMGLPEDELDIAVEKAYAPYSTQPHFNKGVGTYFTTTADLRHLRYDFRSVSSLSPVWLDLSRLNFQAGQPTRHLKDMHLYGSKGWAGNLQARLKTTRHYD